MEEDGELSETMKKKLDAFDTSLFNIEHTLKPFLKVPKNDMHEKIDDPLENAKIDLMVTYSINSLFWAYLVTQGINPKQHPVKNELVRIKEYMGKIKLAEEKKKMARVDTAAAKRFVRNALWEPKKKDESSGNEVPEEKDTERSHKPKKKKRKHDNPDKKKKHDDLEKKKKKKKKMKED